MKEIKITQVLYQWFNDIFGVAYKESFFFFFLILFQADENLRLIRSSLPEAVEACVNAAGHEFDVSRQRTLLRAASYGQAFCR